uniref:stearoyl-CoA desaturase 5-like isoform X2 n=1 Tax=Styela clava TaxID=7725 RepID=UPI00193A46FE|nr:stearoyl-CoA desaturase 5-like isoform X2 [Styela clava]
MSSDDCVQRLCEINSKEIQEPSKRNYWNDLIWKKIIVLLYVHIIFIYTLTSVHTFKLNTIFLASVMYILSGLGVTAGAHRLWSHRSYKAKLPLRIFLAIVNCMAWQVPIYDWCRDHRTHHKCSETDGDPHNARYFIPMALILCFVIPTLIPYYMWEETLWNSYCACVARYCVLLNAAFSVNSFAHLLGSRPYDVSINPRENKIVAFFAMGEGFHNYHHAFPQDYSTSEFGISKLNPTTLFIDMMAFVGLAYKRNKISQQMIGARKRRTGE